MRDSQEAVHPDFGQAARALLDGGSGAGETSDQLAERAAHAYERFGKHLARLIGEAGVQLLLTRSIRLASAQYPWLVTTSTAQTPAAALRGTLSSRDPESIRDSFAAILSAFVQLLERLIGEGLVGRLLDEVWPKVFSHVVKDTP